MKKTEWVRISIRTKVPARTRKRDRHGDRKSSSFPTEWILWIKRIEMHFRSFYCIRRLAGSMSVIFLIYFNCGVAYVWVKHKQDYQDYKITVADFSHFNLYFTLELVLLLKICIRRCYRIRPWSQLLFFFLYSIVRNKSSRASHNAYVWIFFWLIIIENIWRSDARFSNISLDVQCRQTANFSIQTPIT